MQKRSKNCYYKAKYCRKCQSFDADVPKISSPCSLKMVNEENIKCSFLGIVEQRDCSYLCTRKNKKQKT